VDIGAESDSEIVTFSQLRAVLKLYIWKTKSKTSLVHIVCNEETGS